MKLYKVVLPKTDVETLEALNEGPASAQESYRDEIKQYREELEHYRREALKSADTEIALRKEIKSLKIKLDVAAHIMCKG